MDIELTIFAIVRCRYLSFPPLVTTSVLGISNSFHVGAIVWVQFVNSINRLALRVEDVSGTLRPLCSYGIPEIVGLLYKVVFLS